MKSIKKNFVWQSVWQIMSMIIPLITSPIISRALGADGLGKYSYVETIVGYYVLAANLGMYKYGMREVATVRDDHEKLNTVFSEICFAHVLITVIVFTIYILFEKNTKYSVYYFVMIPYFVGSVININWLFFGVEDFKRIAIRDIIIKVGTMIAIIAIIHSEDDLIKYFYISSIGILISNIIYWFMYKDIATFTKVSISSAIKRIAPMAILFIPVLMETLYSNMDKVMLGYLYTTEELGYYDNANKALISRNIVFSITTVLLPRMSYLLSNNDRTEFDTLMKKSTDITVVLTAAFAFGTASIAKEFSVVFWGKEFIKSAPLIMILAFAMPGMILSREVREQYLIPSNNDRAYITSTLIGTLTNFVLNMLFIPQNGAAGAAVATLISEYTVLIAQLVYIHKEFRFYKYIKGDCIYFAFALIMFVIVRIIGNTLGIHLYTLFIELFVATMAYFSMCYIFWKQTNDEYFLSLVQKASNKIKMIKH